MCNAWNHSPGCTCGWGGVWYGSTGVGGLGGLSTFSSSIRSGDPSTRLISCWWCGASVYYHSNGYGDSVLFDSLGYPWQIHECWQRHKDEVLRYRSGFSSSTTYSPYTDLVEAPTPTGSLDQQVSGYIVDNHFFHPNVKPMTLLVEGFPASYFWVYLDVNDGGGNVFRFLIPSVFAHHYKKDSMVEVSGQWSKRLDHWLLAATKISIIPYPSGKIETREFKRTFSPQPRWDLINKATKEAKKENHEIEKEKPLRENKKSNKKNKKKKQDKSLRHKDLPTKKY